ncbi:Putative DNA-binding domain-containing protein [Tenacibaculum mesophilum]|uniref:ATP-binding protein n=1 Tax=Tenacibaculum mesophilum TaxID=104268 RepID=A0ABM7CGR3_9FLAO|nr:ATP-binding protein [Tenacibaculum mesophilum]GFD91465.1 ATPase AAA [Alteromonas sp. KUL154]GFE01470.1 ATPase AAA [Alteromonas sp. KUL156]AZJ32979.1 ATP-binding protein [Tenacibaculum mesophilum]KAF9659176.1 ATP-binding protein [Tenacibaculum mesophilum]QFS28229.1 ATP-binding protein [Tenacibaculum mesophilum]
MINKRLLIKNLLSHNDENSFYDKKQKLSFGSKEGKAKFIKHVCALSNSNPNNNSYIVIGIEDEENKIIGVDFYDDSKIQNLVNAYLNNPPKIEYENVPFPRLQRHKVIGLVTIYPTKLITSLAKNVWKYRKGTIFYRRGSNSMPAEEGFILKNNNKAIVEAIEKNASNNIQLTLDGVFDFINRHKPEYNPQYKVFNEQFVLCWAGKKKIINNEAFFTRVDIELVNEQVRLFFSSLDDVQISYNEQSFIITEYIVLGIDKSEKRYPLEKTIINFKDNGKHDIVTEFLFEAPQYHNDILQLIYDNNNSIVAKIMNDKPLSVIEHEDVYRLPTTYLICYLNGFEIAPLQLKKAKNYIKNLEDKTTYIKYKEAMRVIRKVKYH